MNFVAAVRSVFRNYVNFSGRARRSEYWWFFLFLAVIDVAVTILDTVAGTAILGIVFVVLIFLPSLAVSVRRLHDIDRSGWWVLVSVIPLIGSIWLIVWQCRDSQPYANRFGDSPKYPYGAGWQGQPNPVH